MHVVHALFDRFTAGGVERAPARHVKVLSAAAIDVVRKVQNAFTIVTGFDQHCARAITKEYARRTILVVEDRGHLVAADNQHFLVRSRADELRAYSQSVDKS